MRRAFLASLCAALLAAAGCADPGPLPPNLPPDVAVKELARRGDAEAQASLGWMHEVGQNAEQSYREAARWYERAADQGNPLAQYALAELYARGLGVGQDFAEAAQWYETAARAGNVSAQIRLGHLYETGLGVAQDYGLAAAWYARAAQAWDAGVTLPPGTERVTGPLPQPPTLIPPPRFTAAPAASSSRPGDAHWLDLATFETPNQALDHWTALKQRHADLLGALQASLASAAGASIRVRAGPLASADDAARLCAALRVRGESCTP